MKSCKRTTGSKLAVSFLFAAALSFQVSAFNGVAQAQGVDTDVEYQNVTAAKMIVTPVAYEGDGTGADTQGHLDRRCPLRKQ